MLALKRCSWHKLHLFEYSCWLQMEYMYCISLSMHQSNTTKNINNDIEEYIAKYIVIVYVHSQNEAREEIKNNMYLLPIAVD